MYTFHVYRSGRTFGVYVQPGTDGSGQELVEGGFFSRKAAEEAKLTWEREYLQDLVEKAERAAGWDPNP